MTVYNYNYHPVTGEFLPGKSEDPRGGSLAQLDQLETRKNRDEDVKPPQVYLLSAHATRKPPPHTEDGEAAIFDKAVDEWAVVEDFRGELAHNVETGVEFLVSLPGSIPAGAKLGARVRTLAEIKEQKIKEVRRVVAEKAAEDISPSALLRNLSNGISILAKISAGDATPEDNEKLARIVALNDDQLAPLWAAADLIEADINRKTKKADVEALDVSPDSDAWAER